VLALAVLGSVVAFGSPGIVRSAEDVPTATTVDFSPSIVYRNDEFTLTATVTPNPGLGSVTFRYGVATVWETRVTVPLDADGTASLLATARDEFGTGGMHVEGWFGGSPGYVPSMDVLFVPVRSPPSVAIPNPPTSSQSTSVSIAFSVGPGMTTECRLDAAAWDDCTSPFTASGLDEGNHTFEARATDTNGRTGPARSVTWAVDLTGPAGGTLAFGNGLTSTNVELQTLYYPATDALSGIDRVRVSRTGALDADGDLWIDPKLTLSFVRLWESGGPSTPLYLDFSGPSGPQTVWVQWFDKAGNGSPIESLTVDARVAWLHLGTEWTSLTPTVPFVISGVDPDEIHGVLISNSFGYADGQLTNAAYFDEPPATWNVSDPEYGGVSGDGLHDVLVQWRDEDGSWSSIIDQSIQLVSQPVPDIVIEDGATTTLDPGVWVAPSAGSGEFHPQTVTLGYSCDGTNWSQQQSQFPMIGISLVDPHAGCPTTDGTREMRFRWRVGYSAWSTTRSASINLQWDHSLPADDWLAPAGSVEIEGGDSAVASTAVTLDVPATDGASGVTNVRLSNDGVSWTTRPYAPSQAWTLPAGTGTRTVWASWRDGANNWTAPVSDVVVLDTSKPTVTPLRVSFAVGQRAAADGSMPVSLSWTGADSGSGVAGYDVAWSVDGQAFSTFATGIATPSVVRTARPGHSYRFRVRAIDGAGNRSAWVESTTVRRSVVGDSSSAITYKGTWRTANDGGFLTGTERRSSQAGAAAKVTVLGRAAAWIASVGPGRGIAKVYVDGDLVATVDLGASSTVTRRVVWAARWGSVDSRLVKIKVLGTAGRPRIGLDAIAILR
jgi:hypothetical protein